MHRAHPARFGPHVLMPDLRHIIAQCPHRHPMNGRCGVRYARFAETMREAPEMGNYAVKIGNIKPYDDK